MKASKSKTKISC